MAQPVTPAPTPPTTQSPAAQAPATPAPAASATTTDAATAPTPADGPRTVVVDVAPIGVDPAAARYLTELLRSSVAEMGFRVIPMQELYTAAQRLQLPFPVPAEGVYLLERALQCPVALAGELRAQDGDYLLHLRVRVAVEPTERVRDLRANQFQLTQAVRDALPALLVPPDVRSVPPAPVAVEGAPAPTPRLRARTVRAHPRHWELGGGVIAAFSPGRDSFVNALVAARIGWFPLDRLGFTFTTAYANLRGRDQRQSNVLMALGVETAVDLVPSRRLFVPLRFEVGYLPNNGPVLRLTAGLGLRIGRRFRLEADLISPTMWVLPETTPVSLDLAVTAHVSL